MAEYKKCGSCKKVKDLAAFETHVVNGVDTPYSRCEVYRPNHNASSTKYQKTEKGKATLKRAKQSEKGKATQKRAKQSEKGKAAQKRAKQSEKGKAAKKRANQSEKGLERRRKYLPRRRELNGVRYQDAGFRMVNNVRFNAYNLIKKRNSVSAKFFERTSFRNKPHFIGHLMTCLRARLPPGLTMSDHGKKWQVEHKIPVEAYDFANPVDVKRSWSPSNVWVMTPEQNKEKGIKIIDELCAEVGAAFFPLSWNGVVPTAEQKEAFYASTHNCWARMQAASVAAPSSEAGPSSAGQYSSDSDDDQSESSESDD